MQKVCRCYQSFDCYSTLNFKLFTLESSFSPFPHGTCSLSVTSWYLALRDGPRCFRPDSSCPDVLWFMLSPPASYTGLSPSVALLPIRFYLLPLRFSHVLNPTKVVWAPSLSLAATQKISFDFFSCRYLDVSVPCVLPPFRDSTFVLGSPIRISAPLSRAYRSALRFAVCCVLLRPDVPRHPPYALLCLS